MKRKDDKMSDGQREEFLAQMQTRHGTERAASTWGVLAIPLSAVIAISLIMGLGLAATLPPTAGPAEHDSTAYAVDTDASVTLTIAAPGAGKRIVLNAISVWDTAATNIVFTVDLDADGTTDYGGRGAAQPAHYSFSRPLKKDQWNKAVSITATSAGTAPNVAVQYAVEDQ